MITKKYFNSLFENSQKIVLGISGGLDSMVLLHMINDLKTNDGKEWLVVYVDHQLNLQSHSWGEFVQSKCNQMNIPCKVVQVTCEGKNLEFAARSARYKALCSLGADTVVLAHHMNDRIETFMMKLMRGAGIKGLKSMTDVTDCWFDRKVKLVRPLLNITRDQLQSYAMINHVQHIEDDSNQNNRYDRNWIRNVAWPLIQSRYHIADVNANRSINLLNEAWELTQDLARIDFDTVSLGNQVLDWTKLKNLSHLRLKNLILYIIDQHGVENFSTHHVEDFSLNLLRADSDSNTEMSLNGLVLKKIGHKVRVINQTQTIEG